MDDRSKTCTIMCENMPMCDELNQLLKDEGGYIFGSCDVNSWKYAVSGTYSFIRERGVDLFSGVGLFWLYLRAHAGWLPGVHLRHFSTTFAVNIEDCEGWWLSGCHSSVAEYWLHKPDVLDLIPSDCQPFCFFIYDHLVTSLACVHW